MNNSPDKLTGAAVAPSPEERIKNQIVDQQDYNTAKDSERKYMINDQKEEGQVIKNDQKKDKKPDDDEEDDDPNDMSKKKEEDMIKFSKFFTYMSRKEKALMILGTIGALLAGFLLPCMAIAVGELTNTFDPRNAK